MLVALLGVLAAPAYADPTNAPNIEPFPITCDGVTYTVVTPGQGNWTPALVTTSNQVLIPFSFHITVTNVTTGEVVLEEEVTKAAASHAATTTCTFAAPSPRMGRPSYSKGSWRCCLHRRPARHPTCGSCQAAAGWWWLQARCSS
jgi:hypothetical protein